MTFLAAALVATASRAWAQDDDGAHVDDPVQAHRARPDRHLDRKARRDVLVDRRTHPGRQRPRNREPSRRHPDEQRLSLALRSPRRCLAGLGAPARGRSRCSRAISAHHFSESAGRVGVPFLRGLHARHLLLSSFLREYRQNRARRRQLRESIQQRQRPDHDGGRRGSGYGEPALIKGQTTTHKLSLTSLYPPRRDVTGCVPDAGHPICDQKRRAVLS